MHDTHTAPDGGVGGRAQRRRLAFAFGITATILVAQAIGAVVTGSLALTTDTVHMLVDSSGLLLALVTAHLVLRPASPERTWGFRRLEVVAALVQAGVLLAVGVYALVSGVLRLFRPPEVPPVELLVFGVIGLLCNMLSIMVLAGGRESSFNMRGAFLEVLNDALGSVGVIAAAVVIWATGWQQADAVAGLFIAVLIVPRAVVLLRDTVQVLMEFTPKGLDLADVRRHILSVDHVREVHDLHASTIATGLPVLSAHVVVDDQCFRDGHAPLILEELRDCLSRHFDISIEHSTLQIETAGVKAGETLHHE
ncbi:MULTISPECIES: cation diffusion facilitator family transporter [unclassified Pseudoclavibacter]|uniref:cation diffusion facilitator family transporter n=1 Tax=unclassified Pseudoclavibacter TaxID=2615177 RepID=UPI0013014338|nr:MULTISPECIES: cation diffusion facilitator family transporter [unclassified Pseudoclavibacter]KAB1647512.1 cation transporter [Pseudoclavibacter sp. CFCC 14310]KAB1657075.1 cation transporter [Pseudoclavibacter sp. CFCC 11306]KAB1659884.1 cation transporter [Pseudoclavibacter sp. CFCC 13796]KAB1663145.1 cation transporter [Pseudoclavibacter sp. CFCC 13611]